MAPLSVYCSSAELYCNIESGLVRCEAFGLNLYSHDDKFSCALFRDFLCND